MGINFLHHLNMNQNQINGLVLESLAAAPESAIAGRVYYDTAEKEPKYYSGTAWISLVSKSGDSAVSDRVDALETIVGNLEDALEILADESNTNNVIDRWVEVKDFLESFGDTDSLENVLQNYVSGTYDPTSTVYTLSNSIDFEGVALTGYQSAENYDIAWQINESGEAIFERVQIKSGDAWKPALHTGNTSFTQTLTEGTEIGSIVIGGVTAIKLYAPLVSDSLSDGRTNVALSAKQGMVLNDLIGDISSALGDLSYLSGVEAMDSTPTENSPNLVTSGGVYAAIAAVSGTGGSTIKKHSFTITGNGTDKEFATEVSTALGTPDTGKIVMVYDSLGYQVFPEIVCKGNYITLKFATAPENGIIYKVVAIM